MKRLLLKILLVRNLVGVDNWQRLRPQTIVICLTLYVNIRESGEQDSLVSSPDYGNLTNHSFELC